MAAPYSFNLQGKKRAGQELARYTQPVSPVPQRTVYGSDISGSKYLLMREALQKHTLEELYDIKKKIQQQIISNVGENPEEEPLSITPKTKAKADKLDASKHSTLSSDASHIRGTAILNIQTRPKKRRQNMTADTKRRKTMSRRPFTCVNSGRRKKQLKNTDR